MNDAERAALLEHLKIGMSNALFDELWHLNARLRDENEQMKQMLRPEQVLLVEQTALRNQEARERANGAS